MSVKLGYGVAGWSERLPDNPGSNGIPDAKLLFIDNVIAFDHLKQKLYVISNAFTDDVRSAEEILAESEGRIEATVGRLREARADLADATGPAGLSAEEPSCTRAEFVSMVNRAKEEISAGEVFQIVLSQSLKIAYPTREALTLYRALWSVNPSPYISDRWSYSRCPGWRSRCNRNCRKRQWNRSVADRWYYDSTL